MKESSSFPKRWLNPPELEAHYGISISTQAKMRMKKSIPFSKIGQKFIRYDVHKIDKWLEEHEVVGYDD